MVPKAVGGHSLLPSEGPYSTIKWAEDMMDDFYVASIEEEERGEGIRVGYKGKAEEGGEFAALEGHSQLPHSALVPRSERVFTESTTRNSLSPENIYSI